VAALTVRRLLPVLVLAALVAPAAWAATINGTPRSDRLRGTRGADAIFGLAGNDDIAGLAGNDLLDGGPGRDALSGGAGSDRVAAAEDGARDTVRCGRGTDLVDAEAADRVAEDCEVVSRQLSRDPFSNADSQHRSEVEPASFAFGRTILTAFQSGRFFDGGASGIGFATSADAGRTWRSGFLPGLTVYSRPRGSDPRASDPSVAYASVHGIWLIAALGLGFDDPARPWQLLVSRSPDGLTWSAPVAAVTGPAGSVDKEWLACDNWPASPFRGRCYLSYLDVQAHSIATSTSTDGGVTWRAPVVGAPDQTDVNGAQPLVRPDGTVVVVYASSTQVLTLRSTDGGTTFSPPSRVALLQATFVGGLRSPSLPTAGVDGAGRLYAVWHDCRFSSGCGRNDLVLSTSSDGLAWTEPSRIPTTAAADTQSLLPGLGIDAATSGTTARLAVVYYTLRLGRALDAFVISSADGGATWGRPERLNAESMSFSWLAGTTAGAMVGDYMALSYAGSRAVPVFALASEPTASGTLRESIFARARG
jgi:hypothetical protein